ncbi:MAG: hypothetical protein ACTSXC_07645 [Candidatus Freyarchaeota archaeon]|nr:MAG: hypothetical protein DRO59_01415 [Candidatus Bathyarchaeota archaeon]
MSGKGVSMSVEEFLNEAASIVERAQEENIILRILGALAVHIHCKDDARCAELHKSLERLGKGKPMFTDLDLIGYKAQRKHVKKFFDGKLKFVPDRRINALFGSKRNIFYHPKGRYAVDIFFSRLEFSHDVDFGEKPGKGRLELDFPTITPADIVLEKVQIHEINMKDIVDLIVLFLRHGLSVTEEKDKINCKYIAETLSDDWGFWYDAVNNLEKVKGFATKFSEERKMRKEEAETVIGRVDGLLKAIEEEPKTKRWIKRSKTGTKKIWYRPVEEVLR